MSREFTLVQYKLFQFGPSVLGAAWSHCVTHKGTGYHQDSAHLMPQTGQTTGSHLSHCTAGINFTVSPRGNMTPKLAIKG